MHLIQLRVGALIPHTLHLNVRGSLALRMVIVLVLNTPLEGFDSSVLSGKLSPSLLFDSSGTSLFSGPLLHLVVSYLVYLLFCLVAQFYLPTLCLELQMTHLLLLLLIAYFHHYCCHQYVEIF